MCTLSPNCLGPVHGIPSGTGFGGEHYTPPPPHKVSGIFLTQILRTWSHYVQTVPKQESTTLSEKRDLQCMGEERLPTIIKHYQLRLPVLWNSIWIGILAALKYKTQVSNSRRFFLHTVGRTLSLVLLEVSYPTKDSQLAMAVETTALARASSTWLKPGNESARLLNNWQSISPSPSPSPSPGFEKGLQICLGCLSVKTKTLLSFQTIKYNY